MEMAGRGFSGSYRFGYQGSEKDNEVSGDGNSYTTEFRQLDPRLGRWFSEDPVFQPSQSSYTSMDNDPINLIDPMGTEAVKDDDKGKSLGENHEDKTPKGNGAENFNPHGGKPRLDGDNKERKVFNPSSIKEEKTQTSSIREYFNKEIGNRKEEKKDYFGQSILSAKARKAKEPTTSSDKKNEYKVGSNFYTERQLGQWPLDEQFGYATGGFVAKYAVSVSKNEDGTYQLYVSVQAMAPPNVADKVIISADVIIEVDGEEVSKTRTKKHTTLSIVEGGYKSVGFVSIKLPTNGKVNVILKTNWAFSYDAGSQGVVPIRPTTKTNVNNKVEIPLN
jgi:RHS repeat-associated protein